MTSRPILSRTQRIGTVALIAVATAVACSRPIAGNLAGPPAPDRQQIANAPVVASRAQPVEVPSNLPYFDFQVEKPVQMLPGARGPEYPDVLRASRKEGTVLAQYVVNADGAVDMSTFKVLSSTDSAFSDAVKAALPSIRYAPALVGDRAVKQLVQTPFAFSLSSDASSTNVRVGMTTGEAAMAERVQRQRMEETKQTANLREFTVDRQASLAPEFKAPIYPDALRAERVEGRVLVMIIVNADGTADLPSFKVLKSDHPLFTEAVKAALATARFSPATVQGKAVRQLMQLPFEFRVPPD